MPRLGGVCIAIGCSALGLIPIFKQMLHGCNISSESIALLRILIALSISSLLVLYKIITYSPCRMVISRQHWKSFIGYGVISIAAVNFLYIKSLDYTSAAIAVFSVFTVAPATTIVVASLLGYREANSSEVALIIISIFGCALVNTGGTVDAHQIIGIALAAGAGMCYGLFSIFGANLTHDYDATCMIFWQYLFAGIATIGAYTLTTETRSAFREITNMIMFLNWRQGVGAIGIGLGATFVPYWLYAFGLRLQVKRTTASTLTLMEPIVATIISWFVLRQVCPTEVIMS
jgi:drug/metabolite transporter (DMT)-like permease